MSDAVVAPEVAPAPVAPKARRKPRPRHGITRRPKVVRLWEWEEYTSELLKLDNLRPQMRGQCGRQRPCPFVSCRYNLFFDVEDAGTIRYTRRNRDPWDVPPGESCALDVAATHRAGLSLEEVGEIIGLTRARVKQIQDDALAKIRDAGLLETFRGHIKDIVDRDRSDE